MAIGSDTKLAGPKKPAAPVMAPMVNDRAVQAQQNNQLGQLGAREATLAGSDRAGVSRGKGHRYQSDMAGVMQDASNQAQAGATALAAQQANADSYQQSKFMRDQERITNRGLLDSLRGLDAQERMSKRGNALDQYGTYLSGMYGLDQIRLDKSPLVRALLGS